MDSKQILHRVTQQLKQASTDSPTPAGPTEPVADEQQIAAINQIFELFRFNYHNQFLKAFPDLETLNMAKRLWLRLLIEYRSTTLLYAAELAVKECSYLPNVHEVVARCDRGKSLGLPSAYAAYMEACRAPSPKKEFNWTHPAIYYAGLATDWYFIASEPETVVFPVFSRNYELLMQKVEQGESLEVPIEKALPETIPTHLKPEEQKQRLQSLLDSL